MPVKSIERVLNIDPLTAIEQVEFDAGKYNQVKLTRMFLIDKETIIEY